VVINRLDDACSLAWTPVAGFVLQRPAAKNPVIMHEIAEKVRFRA
jgi:hypothetical protein